MKSKIKKLLALLLCLTMCFNMASPVLAVYYPHGTVIDEDAEQPIIVNGIDPVYAAGTVIDEDSGQIANGGHAVVVVRKIYMRNDDGSVGFRGVEIAEGNYGGKWNWGRQISQADVESGKIKVFGVMRQLY